MLESGVGAAVCVALATLENFTYPSDIFPSSRFYAEDLADPAVGFETSSDGGCLRGGRRGGRHRAGAQDPTFWSA